jgi:transcription initiation factor TFIIB
VGWDFEQTRKHHEITFPYFNNNRTNFDVRDASHKDKEAFYRMKKLNKNFKNNSNEANLKIAKEFLFTIRGKLEISASMNSYVMDIYSKIVKKGLTKGRTIKGLVAASFFIACNQSGVDRSVGEISDVSGIPVKSIRRLYRLVLDELNLKLAIPNPFHYLSNYCIQLKLNVQFQKRVQTLLENYLESGADRNNKKALAIASIYLDSQKPQKITQGLLSDVSGVSEVTIRKYIKKVRKYSGMNK